MKLKSMLHAGLVVAAYAGVAAPSVLAPGPKTEWPVTRPIADRTAAQVRSPEALHSTPLGLKADGLRWQAVARAYQLSERSANTPTPQGLKADGLRWQAIAKAYRQSVAPNAPSPKSSGRAAALIALHFQHEDALYGGRLETSSAQTSAQLMALHFKHEDARYQAREVASGPSRSETPALTAASDSFNWNDALIGAGSAFVLGILGAGATIAIRRSHSRLA
jgi:hypothetical protein